MPIDSTSGSPISSPYRSDEISPTVSFPQEQKSAVRRHMLFAVAVFLLMFLAFKLLKELEIIYVSALFAVVVMPIVSAITRWNVRGYRPSRVVAIVTLLLTIFIVLGLFFIIGLPPVMRDLKAFLVELPQRVPAMAARVKHLPFADKFGLDQAAAKAEILAGATGAYIVTALPRWLSHIFDILSAVFLCIYFMLEGEHAYSFFLSLFPLASRRRLDVTLKKAEVKMSKWLLGQGLLMLILGVLSLIVFGLLHVRYFVLLGVLMGLLNLIPIAGGVITIVLAAAVAALDSWGKMAAVLGFYAVYMNLENVFLTPRIMRSSVNLMGLTVLVALLLGTALAGVVGALVAVPTAALVSVLLEEYAVKK